MAQWGEACRWGIARIRDGIWVIQSRLFLKGRWFRDRVPYERVEAIRLEEDAMDVDVDELEDNENLN